MTQPHNLPFRRRNEPCLTFAPLAWLKLQLFCHSGDTEIGGFGISAQNNLLYVEEFLTVRQEVTYMTVRFLDDSVADYFDSCVDRGIPIERAGRIRCHTHPGSSPEPSHQDELTFARCFGHCDWSVMFIVSRTGQTYARLAFAAGPGGQIEIPVEVDWSAWPGWLATHRDTLPALLAQWQQEHAAHIHSHLGFFTTPATQHHMEETDDMRDWWETHPCNSDLDPLYELLPEDQDLDYLDHSRP